MGRKVHIPVSGETLENTMIDFGFHWKGERVNGHRRKVKPTGKLKRYEEKNDQLGISFLDVFNNSGVDWRI